MVADRSIIWSQGRIYVILILVWIIIVTYLSRPLDLADDDKAAIDGKLRPQYFHLLLAALEPSANLCKGLLSSAVLGYPSTSIIGWKQVDDGPDFVPAPKYPLITGVNQYLNKLERQRDEDLVFISAYTDAWIQLRPQTLIDRYFSITKQKKHSLSGSPDLALSQILVGTQRQCVPQNGEVSSCYSVPTKSSRELYLNSGFMIGPVGAMRELFAQAVDEIKDEPDNDDVSVLNRMINDQLIWYQIQRQSSVFRIGRWFGSKSGHAAAESNVAMDITSDKGTYKSSEYGITIDKLGQISVVLDPAEEKEYGWLKEVDRQSTIHQSIAAETSNTRPPLWTFTFEADLDRSTSWSDVSLLTDTVSNTTPVMVRYSAPALPSDRDLYLKSVWNRQWFQKHARTLYDASIYDPILPVATSGHDRKTQRDWWPAGRWKGGARNADTDSDVMEDWWLRFDDICRDYHEEIFGDGLGPWALPENH